MVGGGVASPPAGRGKEGTDHVSGYAIERVDWRDPLSYVREMYAVPAEVGRRVLFNGEPAEIMGGEGQYVWIVRGEERNPMLVHPTWHMDYLVGDGEL